MRLFIGIPLENRAQEKLTALYDKLEGFRTVKKENLHITLHFMGEQDEQALFAIKAAMENACDGFYRFKISSKRVSGFPSAKSALVAWANIEDGSGPVKKLHSLLESGLKKIKYRREKRVFVPHITLARSKQPADISAIANSLKFEVFSEARSCVLYSSSISSCGPEYKKLYEVSFKERPE